jgi:DNA replication protein DnaC
MKEKLGQLCKQMCLGYVMDAYEGIPFENATQFLYDVLVEEQKAREQSKIKRLLKKAKFIQTKTFEDYSFDSITLPNCSTISDLKEVAFVKRKENILMLGECGTGKTHLAVAMGVEACRRGMKVRFYRVAELVSILQSKFQLGTLERFRKELLESDMLIFDELGFIPFHTDGTRLLFDLISDSHERLSIVVTSNLEFSQWDTVFQDRKLTQAIIDRLVHHAHILAFTGESYRLKNSLSAVNEMDVSSGSPAS